MTGDRAVTAPDSPHESLYAKREPIFPRSVKGRFRTFKWWLMAIMLGTYWALPWVRWDRGLSRRGLRLSGGGADQVLRSWI